MVGVPPLAVGVSTGVDVTGSTTVVDVQHDQRQSQCDGDDGGSGGGGGGVDDFDVVDDVTSNASFQSPLSTLRHNWHIPLHQT